MSNALQTSELIEFKSDPSFQEIINNCSNETVMKTIENALYRVTSIVSGEGVNIELGEITEGSTQVVAQILSKEEEILYIVAEKITDYTSAKIENNMNTDSNFFSDSRHSLNGAGEKKFKRA